MRATILALILTFTAAGVSARPALSDVQEIDDGLLAVGLADRIRKECPSIEARMLRAYTVIYGLVDQAMALGYSREEIDAYRKSKAQKARLRARGEVWLASRGVQSGTQDEFCALGRDEIKKNSQIGALLKVN